MAIPFVKVLITGSRLVLRPINNLLIKKFKTIGKDHKGHQFFVNFG